MASILLPQIAPGSSTATVVRWLKHPGDSFAEGDVLVELEIESALVHIEAANAGTLSKLLVEPNQTIATGDALATVESDTAAAPVIEEPTPVEKPAVSESTSSGDSSNVLPILMPQAGNTMEEGTVLSWNVAEGDQIEVGQIICEIETDKATMEFESPEGGRLARFVAQVDEPVAVKEVIALIADNDADADAWLAANGGGTTAVAESAVGATGGSSASAVAVAPADTGSKLPVAPAPTTTEGRVKASPAARKAAADRGLDLAAIGAGSGPGGRILSTDVESANVSAVPVAAGNGQATRKPMSKMRRAIGLNLQKSKQTVPHFYVRMTIDADPMFAFYREQKPKTNCTLNDVVVLAVGRAIGEFPAVRSQIDGNDIVEFAHANIGIAVGVDDGLIVPVVMNVDTLSLPQLAVETKRVVENGRKGKLENIGQGVFTISNLGMFGVEEFSAIINPPESGILAVSAVRETVIVENGSMRPGRVMTMTLSADHRVVDGLLAAQFVARLKEILENPEEELI